MDNGLVSREAVRGFHESSFLSVDTGGAKDRICNPSVSEKGAAWAENDVSHSQASSEKCEQADIERRTSRRSAMSSVLDDQEIGVRVFKVSWFVQFGGSILALCAGIVNAVSYHALETFTSHMTGTFSKLGMGLEDRDTADPMQSLGLILSFTGGSTCCGLIIAKNTVRVGLALYDIGLMCVSTLLVLALICAPDATAIYLAAGACGLQNGMATEWGGAVIRTTHVTGLFTDVGLLIGRLTSLLCRKCCGRNFNSIDKAEATDALAKLTVLSSIGMSYLVGIVAGAILFNHMEEKAFLVPAIITGTIGVTYGFYRVAYLGRHCCAQDTVHCDEVCVIDLAADDGDLAEDEEEDDERISSKPRRALGDELCSTDVRSSSKQSMSRLSVESARRYDDDGVERAMSRRISSTSVRSLGDESRTWSKRSTDRRASSKLSISRHSDDIDRSTSRRSQSSTASGRCQREAKYEIQISRVDDPDVRRTYTVGHGESVIIR